MTSLLMLFLMMGGLDTINGVFGIGKDEGSDNPKTTLLNTPITSTNVADVAVAEVQVSGGVSDTTADLVSYELENKRMEIEAQSSLSQNELMVEREKTAQTELETSVESEREKNDQLNQYVGTAGGILGGAAAGAAIGSIVPVIGTGVGAVIGGALGGFLGWHL
jgi:hypothetical protein